MQKFDPISTKATLRDSRGLLVNNDRTALSCSSGTAFPTLNKEHGMLCFRTDLNKLYLLKDAGLTNWHLVADLAKTAVDKEYVDQELAKRSETTHNHDALYYTKTQSDARYHTKTQSDAAYLSKTATAADSSKLAGFPATSFARLDTESTVSANMRFADNKELRFGGAAVGRIAFDGINMVHTNARGGSSVVFNLTRTAGSIAGCMSLVGGESPYVQLFYNGLLRLSTDVAGVAVNGRVYATGDIVSASDARLKTNVKTVSDSLDKINKCRGVEFDMNNKRYYGVIAQELETLFPHAVVQLEDEDKTKAVNYSSLVGVLIEAVKELTTRLHAVELAVAN